MFLKENFKSISRKMYIIQIIQGKSFSNYRPTKKLCHEIG